MPKSIRIRIISGTQGIEETIEEPELKQIETDFYACRDNGHNPHLEEISFEHYIRPIKISMYELDTLNKSVKNTHWCTSYVEHIGQCDNSPMAWFKIWDNAVLVVDWRIESDAQNS